MIAASHTPSARMIEAAALAALPAIMAEHQLGMRILIVHDEATYAAAGPLLLAKLPQTVKFFSHSLGTSPHATMTHVEAVMQIATDFSATCIVAIGSGSINDICKLAAARTSLPYIVIATAASMNGYSAANASISHNKQKISVAAVPPRAVIGDLDILAAAPKRLARAGLGDTLCRTTVEADCVLSHYLFATPYPHEFFAKLRHHEARLIAGASALREHSPAYIGQLMHALLDAGDAMTATGSSAVASQGEHMIAHTIELLYGDEQKSLHGEMIAVTSTNMRYLQQKMLLAQPKLASLNANPEQFNRFFGNIRGKELLAAYQKKLLTCDQANEINDRLITQWPEIKHALNAVMIHGGALDLAYMQAGISTRYQSIGLDEARYQTALSYAHLTRDRFTFLDLAVMMGRRA